MVDASNLLSIMREGCRDLIEQETEAVVLRAGDVLFREGEEGDAVYFVVSGSLCVFVAAEEEEHRLISLVGPGETVGEMALISGEPRSATVSAVRDTDLLRLPKHRFDELLITQPQIVAEFLALLVTRLRRAKNASSLSIEPKVIAFVPASPGADAAQVGQHVSQHVVQWHVRLMTIDASAVDRSNAWFNEQEAAHDYLFLIGSATNPRWSERCMRLADKVLVIARADHFDEGQLDPTRYRQRAPHQLLDLVLLHRDGQRAPSSTLRWVDTVPAKRHFHIREQNIQDWDRLARVVTGRALGLVLSGGGARAYAHVGIYRAFTELGLPIDYLGGTSMGAIIAAGIAAGWSVEELTDRVRRAFVQSNPLSDYTLPLCGLVKGKKVERLLGEYFGDLRIPDLWRPFYCVSSNLTMGGLHVHRRGPVAEALRATTALPGILPPVVRIDRVLVDGAATCNLPVNIMRSTHRGPVVAVDVARDLALDPRALKDDMERPWTQRLARLPIVSILIRAGTIASEESDRRQATFADAVITPPLGDIEIRDWKAFDEAVEIGYDHVMRVFERGEAVPLAVERCMPSR